MEVMKFDVDGFIQDGIAYPKVYHTKDIIDKKKYADLEKAYDPEGNGVSGTFLMLKKRTSAEYYREIVASQTQALEYSQYVFPTYKFIMPEALLDDWLAIIDPHREGKRDHSVHQPMTAYIVSNLLGSGDPEKSLKTNRGHLLDVCAQLLIDESHDGTHYLRKYFLELYPNVGNVGMSRSIKHKLACEVFYQTAVTSALFHDIGYPWHLANGLTKSLLASDYLSRNKIYRSADDIKKKISGRLLYYPFHGYSESSILHDTFQWEDALNESLVTAFHNTHGFPGALAFTYLTDIVRQFPHNLLFEEAISQFIIDWASVGILMHDMSRLRQGDKNNLPKPQFALNFDVDPLSCLIAMSDILEEFNRPRSIFTSQDKNVKVEYSFPCTATKVEVKGDILHITYSYTDAKCMAANVKHRIGEIDEYFNNKDRYINLEPLGIKKVKCHVDNQAKKP